MVKGSDTAALYVVACVQEETMTEAGWRLRLLLVALALVLTLPPHPASAHRVPMQRTGIISDQPGWCVGAQVEQEHLYHWMTTYASSQPQDEYRDKCNSFAPIKTWHIQYQEYYKTPQIGLPGTYCFYDGPHQSPDQRQFWTWTNQWDIGHRCNNNGANVYVTHDFWTNSWKPNVGWQGGSWRPATWHCHCP